MLVAVCIRTISYVLEVANVNETFSRNVPHPAGLCFTGWQYNNLKEKTEGRVKVYVYYFSGHRSFAFAA
jgi:hypothetical protein